MSFSPCLSLLCAGRVLMSYAYSFMKNVYTVFSVDDNGVGFAPLA